MIIIGSNLMNTMMAITASKMNISIGIMSLTSKSPDFILFYITLYLINKFPRTNDNSKSNRQEIFLDD
jgi:hypothetical protein